MKCHQVQNRLSAFQDGELKPQEQERVSEHLGSCSACRERYTKMEKVWQALGGFKEILPEPRFYEQITKKINENFESRFLERFRWLSQFFSSPLTTCVLLVLGIVIGTFLGNILMKGDSFPFRQNRIAHSQAAKEVFSLRAFDPIPPGTLGDKYMRMVHYGEEGRR